MTENPLITCTFCRTPFERCRPQREGGWRRVTACKAIADGESAPPRLWSRLEQE